MMQSIIYFCHHNTPEDNCLFTKQLQKLSPSAQTESLVIEGEWGIDKIRQIKDFALTKPIYTDHKIVSIKQAELLTIPAQNALLKILEEPPEHLQICLQTYNVYQLLETIISRCQVFTCKSSASRLDVHSKLDKLSPAERLNAVSDYSKSRPIALDWLYQTITFKRSQLLQQPTNPNLYNLKLLLYCHSLVNKNGNLRLIFDYLVLNYKD